MRIAVIGSGISGLSAAHWLSKHHDVTLFESDDRLGGHTATKQVSVTENGESREYAIDTGFIVFNDWTYPLFIELMSELGVASKPTDMGFSAFKADGSFEYAGKNLKTLFSQKRNLVSPSHLRMLADIVRFNKSAVQDWRTGKLEEGVTLGQYLADRGYSETFVQRYLIPMGSAIWSSTTQDMMAFPLKFFVEFFHNHGLLNIKNRPQWHVIQGGSKQYIEPLIRRFEKKIHLGEGVLKVVRDKDQVEITTAKQSYHFDQVVFACHSDQALNMLGDATEKEKQLLGNIRYRDNDVVLHTDISLLPSRKQTWSSWNYCLGEQANELPVLTYNMNMLQGIQSETVFCVTLNATDRIDPDAILGEYRYAHPIFDLPAIEAQKQWQSINGVNATWYCGAYWFNGFHEDGVRSAKRVVESIHAI